MTLHPLSRLVNVIDGGGTIGIRHLNCVRSRTFLLKLHHYVKLEIFFLFYLVSLFSLFSFFVLSSLFLLTAEKKEKEKDPPIKLSPLSPFSSLLSPLSSLLSPFSFLPSPFSSLPLLSFQNNQTPQKIISQKCIRKTL